MNPRLWWVAVLSTPMFLFATGAPCAPAAMTDLVAHSEIVIDRPAATIWPYIVNPRSWKKGSRVEHVSGEAGALGEVYVAKSDAGEPLFYFTNVEMTPNKRRTIKLYDTQQGPLSGYASWVLEETAGRTRISYHVYSESMLGDMPVEKQKEWVKANQVRFDNELAGLKKMLEAKP